MKRLFTFSILAFFCCNAFSQASSWAQKTGLSDPRNRSRAFSIPSLGKGYIIGGYNSYYTSTSYAYDTLLNSWSAIAPFPGGTTVQVAFSINGKGYVITGVGCCYAWDTSGFVYDPTLDQWSHIASFPGAARGYAVGFAVGGKGYVGCGCDGSPGSAQGLKDFYQYDPGTNTWTKIADYPGAGSLGNVGFAIGSKGYVGTGSSIDAGFNLTTQKDFWEYDPSNNIWNPIADFGGGPRGEGMAFATCDKGYAGGGYADGAQTQFTEGWWSYNPLTNKWIQIADYGGGKHAYGTAFVIGRAGFAGLGHDSTNTNTGEWWEFAETVTPSFTTGNSSSPNICVGQSVSYTDTSNYTPTNWQWYFPGGTPNSSNQQNPVIRYDTAGVYNVVLSAWNGCDSAGKTFLNYVTVSQGGAFTVNADPASICSGQTSSLSATGTSTYTWAPLNALSNTTGGSNITVSPVTTTTYIVTSSGGSCSSTDTLVLTVADNTVGGHVSAVRDTICRNTSGNLSLAGNSSSVIQWQSSLNDSAFTNSLHDTLTDYRTPPLTQSTWYRATVGTGNCSAFSDTLALIVPPALTASFYFTQSSLNQLNFNSDSSLGNIRSYHWDFGDGATSNDSNPSHTFAKDSTYYVCLTLFDGSNCSYTFCRYSSITDDVPTISAAGNWIIYPNPFSEQLTIALGEAGRSKQSGNPVSQRDAFAQSIEMYNVLGQLVIDKNLNNAINTSLQLDVSSLAKGMYYVMIRTADADYVQKVVKE